MEAKHAKLPIIITNESVPPGTILLFPAVERIRVEFAQSCRELELLIWNAKQAGLIKNVEVAK